jgi:hypothetical protein
MLKVPLPGALLPEIGPRMLSKTEHAQGSTVFQALALETEFLMT